MARKHMGINEQEDAVLIDSLIILVTSPVWLARLIYLAACGAWNDWRKT